MIFFENADNRVCILFPYLGRVLAGSTDIKVDRPERVRCEPEERDYILDAVRQVFPHISIDHSDIVYSFSGIRPLPRSDAAFTGRISRSHFIHRVEGDPPQLCMIGGKWTTFRAFGEQVTDEALAFLGRKRLTGTMNRPIGGGRNFPSGAGRLPALLSEEFSIDRDRAEYLASAYGSRAFELMGFCRGRPDDSPLCEKPPITAAEVVWLIRCEHVRHLTDLILRRTTLAITGVIDADLIDAILGVAARELGWAPQQAADERQRLVDELETFYGVTTAMLKHRCKENA
jgi:glycerol-3-phosphate dehydrogenase